MVRKNYFLLIIFSLIAVVISSCLIIAPGNNCYLYDGVHGYATNATCVANGCTWTTNITDMFCSMPYGCCIQKECWQFDNTGLQNCQNRSLNGNLSCMWNPFPQTRVLPNGSSFVINGSCQTDWGGSGGGGGQSFSVSDGCWNFDGNKAQCTNAQNSPKCSWKLNNANQNPMCTVKSLIDAKMKNSLATSDDIGCCETKGCWTYDGNQSLCTNVSFNPSFEGLCTWVSKANDPGCYNSVGCCRAKFCSEVLGEINCTKLISQMFMPCEWNGTACQQKGGNQGGGFGFFNDTDSCMGKGGWWNSSGACNMPTDSFSGGGAGFMFGEGAHCWFAANKQDICQNLTGCAYCLTGTGPRGVSNTSDNNICKDKPVGACEGHDRYGSQVFTNADNSVNLNCTHIRINSACQYGPLPNCIWSNSSAITGSYCTVGTSTTARAQPPVPYCEHPDAKNNYSLCLDLSNIYMMPCKWGNASSNLTASDNCTFNSNAVFGGAQGATGGATMDYNIISNEVSCTASGGTWRTEYYLDGTNLKQDAWCEKGAMFDFSTGQSFGNKGNCDTDCWACDFNSTGGTWRNSSDNITQGQAKARDACQNSAKKICEFKNNTNAPNGLGSCDYPTEVSFGGSQDCSKDCKACEYIANATEARSSCASSVAGCSWINDTSTPKGGFCISASRTSCLTDCFACYEQTKCSNSSFHPTMNCSWDSGFNLCKPKGFTGEVCFNGIDDDNNGQTDCTDTKCLTDQFCGGGTMGSGGTDCKRLTNANACRSNMTANGKPCVWIASNYSGVTGSSYCDFPGANCYLYESSGANCNASIGCIYRNATGGFPMPNSNIPYKNFTGFCDINKTKSSVCFNSSNMNNLTNCNATNECAWVVDPYMPGVGGRCEFRPFVVCGNATSSATCTAGTYMGMPRSQICIWVANSYSNTGGFCQPICTSPTINSSNCSNIMFCAWKSSTCEPESFSMAEGGGGGGNYGGGGFGCHMYDGNRTGCDQQNMTCSWNFFGVGNTSQGICNPKGEQMMMNGMDSGPPKILGQDINDTSTKELDIRMYGIKETPASLGFGITVTNITNAAVCKGYYVGMMGGGGMGQQPTLANGANTTKYYWYLDTNKNLTDGCNATTVNGTNLTGFEFLIKYITVLTNGSAVETKSFHKCVSGIWVLTNVPLTSNRQMMCSMMMPMEPNNFVVGGVMILVDKQQLESFSEYNKTAPMRVFVTSANSSNSEINPLDDVSSSGYYTPGTADFQFVDCSNPNTKDAKCKNFQKFGFNIFEDCKNGKDDDSDGLTDCADPKCRFTPVCSGGAGTAFNFTRDANDNQAPTVSFSQVDVLPDAAFVKFDTDEPANGTLEFYTNDSTCSSLNINATINDLGDPSITFDNFKPFHTVSLELNTLGYNLVNGTTYYYKTTVCDPSSNCATSACLNFTTTALNSYKNFIFKMDLPAGYNVTINGTGISYQGNFSTTSGGKSYPIGIKTNASVSRNINITVTCGNQSLTFVGADILKPKSIDMENAFICNNTNSTSSILGMNSSSKSWNQLIGDIGMGGQSDYIKLTFPFNYSSGSNITWCDDNLSNCTSVNSYANCSAGGTSKTDCKIPTSLGFSAYQIIAPATVATTTTTTSSSSGGGGGGGGGGSGAASYNMSDSEFTSGYTKALAKNDKIKFTLNGASHTITLSSVSAASVTVTVSSAVQIKTIPLGTDAKFDLDGDNNNDLSIRYDSYASNKATIYVKKISTTTAPTTTAPITGGATNEPTTPTTTQTTEIKKSSSQVFFIIGIIVAVAIIIIALYFMFRPRQFVKGSRYY